MSPLPRYDKNASAPKRRMTDNKGRQLIKRFRFRQPMQIKARADLYTTTSNPSVRGHVGRRRHRLDPRDDRIACL
jgi:hypothetical protein